MIDYKLIKKILFDDSDVDIRSLLLVRKVVVEDKDKALIREVYDCDSSLFPVSKRRLLDYIGYYGIDNLYVGERVCNYSNGELQLKNMSGENLVSDITIKGNTSLFKHDEHDYYYYDLLDNSERCEQVYPDLFYVRNGCDNMKSVASLVKKSKKVGRNYDTKTKRL